MSSLSAESPEPDFVIPTLSPFWLRLSGQWCHLEGVAPGVGVESEREGSTFVSIDGVRWMQRAPRANRAWSLEFGWASGMAVRLLELAAQSPEDVWLLDRSLAVRNMLAPEVCQGSGAALMVGGVPLPRFVAASAASCPVRAGVETHAALWTDAPEGQVVGVVSWDGGSADLLDLLAPAGSGPRRASMSFTPAADGVVTIYVDAGTSGLQVTEEWLPAEWHPGQRCPTLVSVADPARTLDRMNQWAQGRGSAAVELVEVGG